MPNSSSRSCWLGMIIVAASACSSGSSTPVGTGGALGSSGGDTASGTGGRAGTGGATGTGGTGGGAVATGGGGGGGGVTGSGGSGVATGGQSAGSGGGGGTSGSSGGSALAFVTAGANGAILTAVRGVTSPVPTQRVQLHNGGAGPVAVAAVALGGNDQAAFQLTGLPAFPTTLAAGADLSFAVQVSTTGAALGTPPEQNAGGTLLVASVTATATTTTGGAAVPAARTNVYAIVLTTLTHEPTLGQILTTLGFKMNVGLAQNNANPNTGTVQQLPKVEPGTDEIAAPLFVKSAAAANVSLVPLARFSPKGPMPFGWYPMGSPATRNMVATMASVPDGQTSDKARLVLPPITGPTTFNPGTTPFGIWVYSDQSSCLYDTCAARTNGDYDYSEDSLNMPANVHRTKVYPLRDAAGVAVAGSYLLAVEEAGNGDYQDFVFVMSNVQAR